MTEAETTRELAKLMRVESSKWLRGFYRLWDDKNYDRHVFFLGLEQILLNFAETLEEEK